MAGVTVAIWSFDEDERLDFGVVADAREGELHELFGVDVAVEGGLGQEGVRLSR